MYALTDLVVMLRERGVPLDLERISTADANVIALRFPGVPADYLYWMMEIGCGEIGDSGYAIFSSLVQADEIYDKETAARFSHLLFFGTDLSGCVDSLDPHDEWRVVQVSSSGHVSRTGLRFDAVIRELLPEALQV